MVWGITDTGNSITAVGISISGSKFGSACIDLGNNTDSRTRNFILDVRFYFDTRNLSESKSSSRCRNIGSKIPEVGICLDTWAES